MPQHFPSSAAVTSSLAQPLVWVIDDDESIRRSLARVFRSAHLPVETLPTARAYLDRAPLPGPSCLVLDVQMPGLNGLELQAALRGRAEQIVFLSGHGDVPMCAQAMREGAVDFLTKPVDDEELLAAVRRALKRSSGVRERAAEHASARARLDTLSPREFEVMKYVIAGMLNKQTAAELGVAEKTIKIHRGQVMHKMGVASVPDLVRVAQAAGIAPIP